MKYMASWKEKGVVPDSDDEESLDSQSNASSANQRAGSSSLLDHDETARKDVGENQARGSAERSMFEHDSSVEQRLIAGDRDADATSLSKSKTHHQRFFPSTSPASSHVFEAPRALWDINLESTDSETGTIRNSQELPVPVPLPAADEISKTYVRLTSPASSLLSSITADHRDEASHFPSETSVDAERQGSQMNPPPASIDDFKNGDRALRIMQEPANPYRRSLRERAPIQLHPYAMEQEKYRRTLKARGMTPMRLAQTLDDGQRRKQVAFSDSPSQDLESQNAEEETEESQQMDWSWEVEPLRPGQNIKSMIPRSESSDGSTSNDDDEFPDIDQLLRMQRSPSRPVESKRSMKTYSKVRRTQLHRIQTKRFGATNSAKEPVEDFDIPASPPATSSPFPDMARSTRRAASQAFLVSSNEPTSSWLDQADPNFQPRPRLLTPVTSAMKPVSDPMFSESDLDDDPFADDLSISGSSPSSDESLQIRKVSKEIRGVLPASHLRLEQHLKRQRHSIQPHRLSLSASPERSSIRRGVALPKPPRATHAAPFSLEDGLPILSDDSDVEDSPHKELTMEGNNAADLDGIFLAHSRIGYAEEEDRIDAMLPCLKRQRNFKTNSRKRLRAGKASLPTELSHQTKITQHLVKGSSSKSSNRARNRNPPPKHRQGVSLRNRKQKPPTLSILDVADLGSSGDGKLPQFIKIAVRTARSRIGLGRDSPSKKFIRLANREDTFDAQSVLEEWKDGRIMPKVLGNSIARIASRPPLNPIANNRQTLLPPPMAKAKMKFPATMMGYGRLHMPRKLVVSRDQLSIKDVASSQQPLLPYSIPDPGPAATLRRPQRRSAKKPLGVPQPRPAQLESFEQASTRQSPSAIFKTTKKTLDALFRLNEKLATQQRKLPLVRFLADDDSVRPPKGTTPLSETNFSSPEGSYPAPKTTLLKSRKRRCPQRIDTGAARYRQPSEPLVLEVPASARFQELTGHEYKLTGLGKYGTRYPIHFDIFPLQSGIFFHESTFIGNGGLSEATKVPDTIPLNVPRGHSNVRLGNKEFRWGQWNEDVSSEVGLLFDCLIEFLIQSPLLPKDSSDPVPAALVEFMIDYVQHHVCFTNLESRCDFLTRMLEALQDFSTRISEASFPSEDKKAQHWIETIARCAVLILQLLHVSRAVQAVTTLKLENLLKCVAYLCVKFLISRGLETLRKLYEDLQYLSFRERGIKNDQYVAVSWVMILRVLNTAQIPKVSFWDVTNLALMEGAKTTNDARLMEQIWYSMYSLLPLCEFDAFGVIVPGLRHRVSFDNWTIPQRMLREVFALYTINAKQCPGFNDYCRALVNRCHYLMREWGWWKCNGMIGTVFDFFAAQKLGHLRNEEVYKSPRFLEELDTEPSLDVEPEDRCFHIFLKIIVLAIKHLRQVGDERSIRNLVARLLPNHDRQYPKEESIHQRDLAALRNHHDLLCTLYWASPQECRPSLSLIQSLVVADRSHKEACLINLRALDNLARFVFTSLTDESAVYPQITSWELTFFDKLLHQYLGTSTEVRKQAELLSESYQQPITEMELQEATESSKESTANTIRQLLFNLRHRMKNAKDVGATIACVNFELFPGILNPEVLGIANDFDQDLIAEVIITLLDYMDLIDSLQPFRSPLPASSTAELDSQGSFDFMNMERQIMIHPLHNVILHNLANYAREILECRFYKSAEPTFMENLVLCWSRLVSLITEETFELRGFIIDGANAIFANRQQHARAAKYWPLFIAQVCNSKESSDFRMTGFDLGLEWMQVITSKPALQTYEPCISTQLYRDHFYLLRNQPWHDAAASEVEMCDQEAFGSKFSGEKIYLRYLAQEDQWPTRHSYLFRVALNEMREVKLDPNYGRFAEKYRLSEKETHSLFSTLLKNTMDSMQRHLESMAPSTAQTEYVEFCQDVISSMRTYTGNIQPITDFFHRHSLHYWPKIDDPQLYAAGIESYSLRLHDQSGKTPLELFHYLYNGWKNYHSHSEVDKYIKFLLKGMKSWVITEFMLANFVPATLLAGFNAEEGCVLPMIYLPALVKRGPQFLGKDGPQASCTFAHMVNILKMIINGIRVLVVNWYARNGFGHDDIPRLQHKGIISTALNFWLEIRPDLIVYVDTHPAEMSVLEEVTESMNQMISYLGKHCKYVGGNDESLPISWSREMLYIKKGEYVDRFVAALQDDVEKDRRIFARAESLVARQSDNIYVPVGDGVSTLVEVVNRLEGITKKESDFPKWKMETHVKRFPGTHGGFL